MSQLSLPPAMADLRSDLGSIVAEMERRAPYAAVWASADHGLAITLDDREENVTERPRTSGTVLTVFDGECLRERAVGGFDRAAVAQSARELTDSIGSARARSIDPGPARTGDFATARNALTTIEKLERLRDLHRRVRAIDSSLASVRVRYLDLSTRMIFRNRTADLAQHIDRMYLMVFLVAASDTGRQFNFRVKASAGDWDALAFDDDELRRLVDTTHALLAAGRVTPGEYDIITGPSASGVLAHESFGHGVETDMFLKERAKAAHFIDRVVASPLVGIYDDPSVPGKFGSYFFDDEGQPAGPTAIVENGVFKRGITDLYSALALNMPRTANGRRQDYTRKVYARMSNTFFGRGETPVSDLFAQVDHGLYLEQMSSGMEDPQGWGIQVTCHYGREIKHGRLTDKLYAPVVIGGYVPDVLQTIRAVGDDFHLDAGVCGKGHKEIVTVTSGGPHLLMKARLS